MADQIDKDRFLDMAECYDRMASRLVPAYDLMQDEMLRMVGADGVPGKVVVDLGGGSGIFLEKVLTRYPASKAVWVDYSPDFEAVARERLRAYPGRVTFVRSAMEDAWEQQLDGPPDAICSMSAIHHMESAEKRRLYRRCAAILRPGGWFFNADETSTFFEDAYRNSLKQWVGHVDRSGKDVPAELSEHHRAWCRKFDGWKARNLEPSAAPKAKGDDIHEPFGEQVLWLREAGLVETDVFLKYHLWSLMGGRKPPPTDDH
jgi:tRNA (cmo5U34)-methyltransferase